MCTWYRLHVLFSLHVIIKSQKKHIADSAGQIPVPTSKTIFLHCVMLTVVVGDIGLFFDRSVKVINYSYSNELLL